MERWRKTKTIIIYIFSVHIVIYDCEFKLNGGIAHTNNREEKGRKTNKESQEI